MAVRKSIADQEFDKYRAYLIRQGEREHIRSLEQFPVKVRLSFGADLEHNTDIMSSIEDQLALLLGKDDFRAFPGTSIGRFRDDVYCVFFRDKATAMMAKLSINYDTPDN